MKQSTTLKLLGALTATISLSVSLFTAYWVKEKMTSEALSSMRRVTVVLAEQTYSAFEVIDAGMVRSVREIEHRFPRWMDTNPHTLHDILANDKVAMPQVRYLLTANDKAVVTALSHMDTLPDIHVDDRPYFIAHARTASKADTGLYIGTAIIGRTTGEHIIPLSRRLDIDGYFAGVLMAALDANYFQRLYAKLYVPDHGAVYVTKSNKEVLAIYPDNTPDPGRARLPFVHSARRRLRSDGRRISFSGIDSGALASGRDRRCSIIAPVEHRGLRARHLLNREPRKV